MEQDYEETVTVRFVEPDQVCGGFKYAKKASEISLCSLMKTPLYTAALLHETSQRADIVTASTHTVTQEAEAVASLQFYHNYIYR